MSLYPLSRPCPKCGAKLGELCGNTPAHPCDERWGDLIDGDKLRALADALGQVPDDTPDAAYFGLDMTHGQARGNLAAILAMAEDNRRLKLQIDALLPHTSHAVGCAIYQKSWALREPDCSCGLEAAHQALAAPGNGG